MDEKTKKEMQALILETVKSYSKSSAFTDRKLTDIPTDDLAVVNRKYLTANGTFATRPPGAVTGQPYFATDLGYPAFFNGTNWVGGTGSILGIGL